MEILTNPPVQLLPAGGWSAEFETSDGEVIVPLLVCWALTQAGHIEGVVVSQRGGCEYARAVSGWLSYIPPNQRRQARTKTPAAKAKKAEDMATLLAALLRSRQPVRMIEFSRLLPPRRLREAFRELEKQGNITVRVLPERGNPKEVRLIHA